ncbi:LppA family lipoprotein [Nocardia arthritidis]|uniref:Uncharacterized protein n=1 Tax=Nocardia arthritidis TaxID=228602 RepID=A0A6G9Y6I8_9NOCA|nr:LppA family lipoprotein [Nocardia arthritidis]QIS08809.1 hypothetical protein F5544_04475 [Nocardia arthritidis]
MTRKFSRFQRIALGIAAVGAAAMLLLIGWTFVSISDSNPPHTSEKDTAEAAQRLLKLPPLEDAEAELRAVVQQIGAAATELVPGMKWEWNRDPMRSDCPAPYDQTNGQISYLRHYYSDTPIPDDVWPQFLDRVRTIAATVGATAPETMQNQSGTASSPGNHDVWFSNPSSGTTIKVGTQRASVISATVGCHLPKDKFSSPTPTPKPTS